MTTAKRSADIEPKASNFAVMAWLGTSLLVERIGVFPSSGDLLRPVKELIPLLAHLKSLYVHQALDIEEHNGLKMIFNDWRFRVRPHDSDPVVVITIETRCDADLMPLKTAELLGHLEHFER